MSEIILERNIIFFIIGVMVLWGIVSKIVVNTTLKRLVYAAGNMSKSNHPFMRLVRAKFEHACMVSETVENVDVFVDKYLYEYKVAGIRLHSIRRMEITSVFFCILWSIAGALLEYRVNGMGDAVLQTGAAGVIAGIFVYLFHLTTDENYRLAMVKNYMVDYLQNVCLHRYEKAYQKEMPEPSTEPPVMPEPSTEPPVMPEVEMLIREAIPEPMPEAIPEPKEEHKPVEKDILIRQILEEFMA